MKLVRNGDLATAEKEDTYGKKIIAEAAGKLSFEQGGNRLSVPEIMFVSYETLMSLERVYLKRIYTVATGGLAPRTQNLQERQQKVRDSIAQTKSGAGR